MEDFKGMEVMLRSHAFEQIWSKVLLDHIDQADGTAYVFMEGFKNSEKVSLNRIIPVEVYEELKATDRLHRVVVVLPKKYKYNCKTHSWETEIPTELLKEIGLEDSVKFDNVAQDNGSNIAIDDLIYAEYIEKYGREGVQPYFSEIHQTSNKRAELLEKHVEFLEYFNLSVIDPTVSYDTPWGSKVFAYIKKIANINLPQLTVLYDANEEPSFYNLINKKSIIVDCGHEWKEVIVTIHDIK